SRCSLALSVFSSWRSRSMSACSASACEWTDTYSPAAIDMAPATRPATPAMTMFCWLVCAAATPSTRLAVETMPSLAPSTAARNQPTRSMRCPSRCDRRMCGLLDSVELARGAHRRLSGRRRLDLQSEPFGQLDHALVVCEHVAVNRTEPLALRVFEQQPGQCRADAAALPVIADRDAEFAVATAGVRRITRHANDLFGRRFADHGYQGHARVTVDVHQLRDQLVAGFTNGVHETLEARFGGQALDELALARGVVLADWPDAVFHTIRGPAGNGDIPHFLVTIRKDVIEKRGSGAIVTRK